MVSLPLEQHVSYRQSVCLKHSTSCEASDVVERTFEAKANPVNP